MDKFELITYKLNKSNEKKKLKRIKKQETNYYTFEPRKFKCFIKKKNHFLYIKKKYKEKTYSNLKL